MSLEPVSDGKEIVTLMCGNKTKTSVCADIVFSFYLCTSVMFTGSWWGKSIHHVNVRGLVRDVTMSQWGWMRRKLVVFLLFYRYMNYGLCFKQWFQNISDCFLDNSNCESVLNSGKFKQWLPTHQRSSLLW